MKIWCILLLSAVLTGGCVAASLPAPDFTDPVDTIPYRVDLSFRSELPEPFYVSRGPDGSYRRYPVNDWLANAMTDLASAKSGGQAPLAVSVRVLSLRTDFEGIGEIVPFPSISRGDPPALPERAVKSAVLTLAVDVAGQGSETLERTFVQDLVYTGLSGTSVYREAVVDYRPVLSGVVLEAVRAVNDRIDRAVAKKGE